MYIYKTIFFLFFFFPYYILCSEVSFTIEPDGSNLPKGIGYIRDGQKIYAKYCSSCHGHSGEGLTAPELTNGSANLTGENISLTIGNYWPYAPKIFDYIRRAKRKENNFFSNNEVYSLTGYLLKLNYLYNKKSIDKISLSNIIMPNREGFIDSYSKN